MRILIILSFFITAIIFGNSKTNIAIIASEKLLPRELVSAKKIDQMRELSYMKIKVESENEEFKFVNDCIEIFSKLNEATNKFYSKLENNTNTKILIANIDAYNEALNHLSIANDSIYKYTQSENRKIRKSAIDLSFLINDLTALNYEFLNFIILKKHPVNEVIERNKLLIKQNKINLSSIKEISLEIRLTLVKESLNNKDEQCSVLTLNQRDLLNSQLIEKFGKSVKKRDKNDIKNSIENSSSLIYEFLNMEWIFKNE
ncbi:hypothetical protein H0I23_04150 [Cellulophaga sp. HaHaR_3_176]|uniref:hypothetical protein n=1 Tax=Cellulophaga sp. HaHaR_3_176 TaxID=1942464 RepID=UPI001C1FF94B|nr:hypothetical protein [Cellulophaga sp. HaHaR_3_176]QWX84842.1 hypothetical protein H0I23_04150 [Cellulophaga sp. HaHaR_3_176]